MKLKSTCMPQIRHMDASFIHCYRLEEPNSGAAIPTAVHPAKRLSLETRPLREYLPCFHMRLVCWPADEES